VARDRFRRSKDVRVYPRLNFSASQPSTGHLTTVSRVSVGLRWRRHRISPHPIEGATAVLDGHGRTSSSSWGFVTELGFRRSEVSLFGHVGSHRVTNGVPRHLSIRGFDTGLVAEPVKESPKATGAVRIAVTRQPERIGTLVPFVLLAFLQPTRQRRGGTLRETDGPVPFVL